MDAGDEVDDLCEFGSGGGGMQVVEACRQTAKRRMSESVCDVCDVCDVCEVQTHPCVWVGCDGDVVDAFELDIESHSALPEPGFHSCTSPLLPQTSEASLGPLHLTVVSAFCRC